MKDPKQVKKGIRSRAQGAEFEKRVRKNLEENGWVVDKWTNQVEWDEDNINRPSEERTGKLVPAKPHMVFNPQIKRMIPLQRSSGFPDFIAMTMRGSNASMSIAPDENIYLSGIDAVIGVESKMNGKLDLAEKEKADWLLKNRVFDMILIAEKTKVKNKIHVVYHEYKTKT